MKNVFTTKRNNQFLTLCFLLFVSCAEQRREGINVLDQCNVVASCHLLGNDTLIECDLRKVEQDIILPLSLLTDTFELVKLDNTSQNAFVSMYRNLTVSDNYLAFSKDLEVCKLFTRQGKYLMDIGKIGSGPSEYDGGARYVQIDEINQLVYVVGVECNSILAYSLVNGAFVSSIPLAYKRIMNPSYVVNWIDRTVWVVNVPINRVNSIVWLQDFEGNIIQEIPAIHYQRPPYLPVGKERWSAGNDMVRVLTNTSHIAVDLFQSEFGRIVKDSVWRYDQSKNKLIPCFTINFENNDNIPHNWVDEWENYYLITLLEEPTPISGGYSVAPSRRFLVDKKSLRGASVHVVLDALGNFPIDQERIKFDNGYFWYNIEPWALREKLQAILTHPENLSAEKKIYLKTLFDSISEDDNNYIFLGRLKK